MLSPLRAGFSALLALAALAGCGSKNSGNYACGIAAVAGHSLILEEFTRPGKTLSVLPQNIPAQLPVRIALGPAFRSITGRADSMLIVGMEGTLPPAPPVGWGVLIVNPEGTPLGVMLYQGDPIQGAPRLGTVNAGERNLPLVGLSTTIANFEDPSCPIFPDSLGR